MSCIENRIKELESQISCLRQQLEQYPTPIKISDRSYSVSETPVTVAQYRAYCNATGRTMPDQPDPQNDDNPVTNVNWQEARDYCKWLSERVGKTVRLPVEDEFEHFCGDHTEANDEIAVTSAKHIMPVKTKKPNKYGLYDVLGGVWEWQESPYS